MYLRFSKMQGIGNDFVVLDDLDRELRLDGDAVRRITDRRRGVGCDQLLVAEPPDVPGALVRMRVYNSDGSEAQQCGNGLRCFVSFLRERGIAAGPVYKVQAGRALVEARLRQDGTVDADMGVPVFEPARIPFLASAAASEYELALPDGSRVHAGAVSMGNPHAVLRVADVAAAPVASLGPAVQSCGRFPQGVNVGFMEVVSPRRILLRVCERGVGETLACGSGACAAVACGRIQRLLDEVVDVDLPGGRLQIRWPGGQAPVWMTGPATHVFEGGMEL